MRKVWYDLWQDFANIVGEAYRMEKYVNVEIMAWQQWELINRG